VSGSAQIVTEGVNTIPAYADDGHGGAPLAPGGPGGGYSNARSWYDAVNARTLIGLSRDSRTLTLFTVDRGGDSEGMKVGEAGDVLVRDYGVWNALNLDGGGSTSMAMEDPVTHERALVNVSSDNAAGRAVGSSLAVFARPR
jgi:exopolysaccharide biosynthesis protein